MHVCFDASPFTLTIQRAALAVHTHRGPGTLWTERCLAPSGWSQAPTGEWASSGSHRLYRKKAAHALIEAAVAVCLRPTCSLHLQLLLLRNTTVIAAARPVDDFVELHKLHHQFRHRLLIVEMELLDQNTIKASGVQTTTLCCTFWTLPVRR